MSFNWFIHFWVVKIFAIVLLTLVAHNVQSMVFKRLYAKLIKTRTFWDHILIQALRRPLGLVIWALGIAGAASLAWRSSGFSANLFLYKSIEPTAKMSVLIAIVWASTRFIRLAEKNLTANKDKHKHIDQTALHAICQLLVAAIMITFGLTGMQILNIDTSALIAFGGIGGAGIAFAAKDLLANFFGGLMIYLDRPFKVGDWIRSPDRNIEGTVEHIGWRLTRIRTFDKRPLFIPNNIFSIISVENPSRMSNRRIKTNIGLRYDDALKIDVIIEDVKSMLKKHPEIDPHQTLIVNLVEFGASSLNFMVYTFTKTTNWIKFQAVQQDVFLKIINIIDQHGAECAFPTTTLHVPGGLTVKQKQAVSALQNSHPASDHQPAQDSHPAQDRHPAA